MDYDACQSLTAMFFDRAAAQGERPFLWARRDGRYRPWSWRRVDAEVRLLARALRVRGIADGERVVLVSENRPEWLIADLAIMAAGAITVPAYTSNTATDHRHILIDSGAAAASSSFAMAQHSLTASDIDGHK